MVKSGQRKSNELIIRSRKNWLDEGVLAVLSLLGWSYCLLVIYFFISAIMDFNDRFISIIKISFKMTNQDIREFVLEGLLIWMAFYFALWLWKVYNTRRFGSLTRRKYPKPATNEDLLALQLMKEEDMELVQQSKYIVFEKNPIRDF